MIITLTATIVVGFATDPFQRAISSHSKFNSGSVVIKSQVTDKKGTASRSYDLVFIQPSQIRIRITQPKTKALAASDRAYLLKGNRLVAYDYIEKEKLTRTLQLNGNLADRIGQSIGSIDDPLQAIIKPSRISEIMKPLVGSKGWTTTQEGSEEVLTKRLGPKQITMWRFSRNSGLLTRMSITTVDGTLDWTYRYGAKPKSVDLMIPAGTPEVISFSERPIPPKYSDAKSKKIGTDVLNSFFRMRSVKMNVKAGKDVTSITFSDQAVRESNKSGEWSYDGTYLRLINYARKTFAVRKVSRSGAIDALALAGVQSNAYARSFLMRKNPIQPILFKGMTFRFVGGMKAKGMNLSMVEGKSKEVTVNLVVNDATKLPVSISSEIKDRQGRSIMRQDQDLSYSMVNKPISANEFQLRKPAGFSDS